MQNLQGEYFSCVFVGPILPESGIHIILALCLHTLELLDLKNINLKPAYVVQISYLGLSKSFFRLCNPFAADAGPKQAEFA